jgi:iron complex outermembrane recepter protein
VKNPFEVKFGLLATSAIAGVGLVSLGMTAHAQDAETVSAPLEAQAEEEARQETVTITGSLIPTSGNLIETSPVTSIGAEEFDVRGVLRVEDVINTLPQAFAAQGSNLANGATGTASVDLRGLGSSRTLVLVNGRRLPYGSLNTVAPDINFIPSQLVKNVDVLTGGASATYGSDAISGVVNFVLDTDFEGFRIDGNYSFFQHNNDNDVQSLLQEFAAINPSQYAVPDGNTTDGESVDVTAIFGANFDNGKGGFTGYFGYQNTNEILQANRDYSQCALSTRNDGQEFTCAGSSTNQFANILELDGDYNFPNGSIWARVDPNTGTFIDRDFETDTFNFNPFNHYQRPNERYNFGMFADYQVADNIEAYAELMFMDNKTNSQIAPSGVFGLGVSGDAGGINCNNVFFSDQQFEFLCGSAGLTEDDIVPNLLILRRNVEGGLRNNDIRHTAYRGVIGIRGDLEGTPLSYDISAVYANVHRAEVYNNDLSKRKIANALFAVEDPETGLPVCNINIDDDPSNDDAACVPYDIWSGAAPDPAAVNYIVSPLNRDGETTQSIVTAKVFGDMEEWGIKSPMAEDALAFAIGAEYRSETLDSNPDANFQSGDGAGQGGPTNPISGSQDTIDIFGELQVPLIQGRPGIEQLGADFAYRRSDYDTVSTDAYKVGVDYAPTSDVRFRASYQRAVRAPNIFELFSTQSIGLFDLSAGENGLFDPCSGTDPAASLEACANTGVTPEQYGNIADNPAGQFNNFTGGNPDLEPETADTFTVGFVATPSMVPGLTFSIDYFDIEVEDLVGTVPEQLALDQCLATGDAFFCDLINRGVGGTLWANQTGFVTATNINTGSLSTSGIDVLASYTYETAENGTFDIDFVATYLDSLETKPLPTSGSDEIYDCVGFYGGNCGAPNPEYRHKATLSWNSPNAVFGLSGTWRYYDEVSVSQSSSQPALTGSFAAINETLDAQNYFDASARWQARESVSLRLGVNNLLDEDPPLSSIVGTAPGNGNTYPQVYDAFGRYVFLGATVDF